MLVETEQPAGDEDRRGARRRRVGRRDKAWKTLNEADGFVPYIDYATPTFYDDISGGVQQLLADAGARRSSSSMEAEYAKFTGRSDGGPAASLPAPADGGARGPGARPPGEPRRVAYLYILPALAVFVAFVLAPLATACWMSLFAWDGVTPGKWVASRTTRQVFSDPELRAAFVPRARARRLLRGAADGHRAGAGGGDVARARARAGGVPDVLFLPQVIALVVVAVMWRMIYAPDGGLINERAGAVGLGALAQDWLGSSRSRCPRSG